MAVMEGRGSLSGRNKFARWQVCDKCQLRILYVPTCGSKVCYRQAGSLAPDTAHVMTQIGDRVEKEPAVREHLNSKAVSVQGAPQNVP